MFCDGTEFCDPKSGECIPGLTCPAAIEGCKIYGACDEENDECISELDDGLCEDGEFCNEGGNCQGVGTDCAVDADCDDGLFCTGAESCIDGFCAAVSACPPAINGCVQVGAICDEETDTCLDEPDDSLCDNGLFCDGTEFCDPKSGECLPGLICPAAIEGCKIYGACDEDLDECISELDDELCEAGEFCHPSGQCLIAGPLYLFAAGTPCGICGDDDPQFDALALTNFAGTTANVSLELILPPENGNSPGRISAQGANQAALALPPGQQVASLRTDLFEDEGRLPAWIELTGDTGSLGTFFQYGTGSLSQLDGGVAISETSTSFIFTRVFDGPGTFRGQDAGTAIIMFNPNNAPATVDLTYLFPAPAGSTQALLEAQMEITARGLNGGQPSDLFGAPIGGGVITAEVTQGDGVVATELIQLVNQTTILGLNAATGNPGNVAYSAQLASQPGLYTSVNVHNSAARPRNITLSAIGEDGGRLAASVQQLLQPGQTFTADAGDLFGGGVAGPSPSGEVNLVGSLVVEADGDGIVGDVIFGDATNFQYAASLPLQTQTFEEALFNQVANIEGFFTGLAFFYPGDSQAGPQGEVPDAEITIQVFMPDGTMVGQSVQTLAVGQRILEFPRFRGHLILWENGGHDAKNKTSLSTRVSPADSRASSSRAQPR